VRFSSLIFLFFLSVLLALCEGKRNVVIYWGQCGAGLEPPLATVCENDKVGTVILAFVYVFFNPNDDNLPLLNLAGHCTTCYPGHQVLHCPQVAADIKTCQSKGINITLSLGGAIGDYGFNSQAQAIQFAQTIYDEYFSGNSSLRPFDDVVLDGVDLDIEGYSPLYYTDFISELRSLQGDFILSGAPQCPYPDGYLGPTIAAAGPEFDFLSIQFYNNWCYVLGTMFNFNTWVNGTTSNIMLYVGLPASQDAAGDGYVPLDQLAAAIQPLFSEPRFGGIMLWDAGWNQQTNYSENAYQILNP